MLYRDDDIKEAYVAIDFSFLKSHTLANTSDWGCGEDLQAADI